MEHIENVLQKVKDTRVKQGFSHENMAFELGISQAAYCNIEKNHTKLSVDRLIEISNILNKPIYHFFETNPSNVFHQDLKDHSIGYHQQNIENLYQANKEVYEKLENSYKEMIQFLKEENAFLKEKMKDVE